MNRTLVIPALCAVALVACSGGGAAPAPAADVTPPTVPAGVTAAAPTHARVDVTWSPSADAGTGVGGYEVLRDGVPVATVAAPATGHADETVSASTAYVYTVRAFDRAAPPNFSAVSAPAGVTTPPRPPGLDVLPSNTTCLATDRPTPGATVYRADPYPGVSFQQPVKALQAPGDPSRWFVVEQGGKVWSFQNVPGVATTALVLDLAADPSRHFRWGGEMGFLGMAFHPAWPVVLEAFLVYTTQDDGPPLVRQTHLSRFRSLDGGATLDPSTEQVLLAVDQPDVGHKAGDVRFGADGFLYVSLGDGGGSFDQYGNGQRLGTVLAKILRIDVVGTGPTYAIPTGNPFAVGEGGEPRTRCPAAGRAEPCPETWAFGFRNPWRWSFDRATGDMWVADVGQDEWEEVNVVEKGMNYGWSVREGKHCLTGATCAQPGTVLGGALVVDPVVDYPHHVNGTWTGDSSVTGGFVYRGTAIPALAGLYVFGDFLSGNLWTHVPGLDGDRTLLLNIGFPVSSFAEDVVTGELYATDYGSGRLFALAPLGVPPPDPVPMDLAEACPSALDPDGAGSVLVPYAPNAPFWSDGAEKHRWMALPDGTSLTVGPDGDWDFPVGTVLVKEFRLGGQRVETRLLMRHTDGVWGGYTYEWNAAGTAATRVLGGKTKVFGAQTWLYPSEPQCLQCHTAAARWTLGAETAQQNGDLLYPSTGRTANQLETLAHLGLLTLPGQASALPAYPAPFAPGPVEPRARAYLHANCSNCHRPGGPTPALLDLRFSTPLAAAGLCDAAPGSGDLGLPDARIVAPGAPERSLLLERMKRTDAHRMPPLGRFVTDAQGVALVSEWIAGLTGCP